jgi:hypothetical protein
VIVAALLLVVSLSAQPSATYNLAAIRFTGLHRYTLEQGSAASGLHIGGSITPADLQAAAERLSQDRCIRFCFFAIFQSRKRLSRYGGKAGSRCDYPGGQPHPVSLTGVV